MSKVSQKLPRIATRIPIRLYYVFMEDVPQISPKGLEGRSLELQKYWNHVSLRTGWMRASDWLVPEVQALTNIKIRGGDLHAAVSRLGGSRAYHGVGIRETMLDLRAFCNAAKMVPDYLIMLALVEGWAAENERLEPHRHGRRSMVEEAGAEAAVRLGLGSAGTMSVGELSRRLGGNVSFREPAPEFRTFHLTAAGILIDEIRGTSYTLAGNAPNGPVLLVIVTGSIKLALQGRVITVSDGDVVLIHSGRFSYSTLAMSRVVRVSLTGSRAHGQASRSQVLPPNAPVKMLVAVVNVLISLARSSSTRDLADGLEVARHTAGLLLRRMQASSEVSELFTHALELIARRYRDPAFTTETLAKELGVSERTLHRVFAANGLPPGRALRLRRLKELSRLIRRSRSISLADAALQTGFSTYNSASIAFKKHYGISMGEARSRAFNE
ncbi:transcriptional regulator, AraC family domain [Paenarthrobacter aurescens TC1]|uniref:Transcriptional regulator, AraC family domain n=2 Tax=Paenarthrobacter aurescens TaxID=43663 RepID=A1RBZ1_PAEAT|nr:transcriptional regulator, AraC family domain [Paenarthrobacter aurescens TC1]